jgi:hypothetical protein
MFIYNTFLGYFLGVSLEDFGNLALLDREPEVRYHTLFTPCSR